MHNIYGLIGYPLEHSFSQRYFEEKFIKNGVTNYEYVNLPIENISMLPLLIASHPDLRGFNVTIPYKEKIIPYLDKLEGEAADIGAVNCVKISENGKLTGYNTDAFGFRNSLLEFMGGERPSSALVLGTGGASKAVVYVLGTLGIGYRYLSRTKGKDRLAYGEVTNDIISDNLLIINTTPLGTFPNTDTFPPIPYDALTPRHFLFDLVYNPEQTMFMKKGGERGAKTVNGYKMLVGQAEKSWEIWNIQR